MFNFFRESHHHTQEEECNYSHEIRKENGSGHKLPIDPFRIFYSAEGCRAMIESPFERLVKTHPDMEIWWDSSPLVYNQWVQKMLGTTEEASRKSLLKEQFARLYNVESPALSVFRGCTTNPPLSWQAIQADPVFWGSWINDLIRDNPDLGLSELVW